MKSDATIQAETARAWEKRAVMCYRRYVKSTPGGRAAQAWLERARSYTDEALEHAALTRDRGKLVWKIQMRLAAAERSATRKSSRAAVKRGGRSRYGGGG